VTTPSVRMLKKVVKVKVGNNRNNDTNKILKYVIKTHLQQAV